MFKSFNKLFFHPLMVESIDFLNANALVKAIFVFQKRGQPKGIKKEYWIDLSDKSTVRYRTTGTKTPIRQANLSENTFSDLLDLLENYNFWKLKDDLGTVKDGIHYTLVFASKNKRKKVAIWNPEENTASFEIVERVNEFFENLELK
jgi:hypothetical protein